MSTINGKRTMTILIVLIAMFEMGISSEELVVAAARRSVDDVKRLLVTRSVDVNYGLNRGTYGERTVLSLVDPDRVFSSVIGMTALHTASMMGYHELVSLLLAAPEIKINKEDYYGHTALYTAARLGNDMVVSLLLAAPGIEVNHAVYGDTPLSAACLHGHSVTIDLLLAIPGVHVQPRNRVPALRINHRINVINIGIIFAKRMKALDSSRFEEKVLEYINSDDHVDLITQPKRPIKTSIMGFICRNVFRGGMFQCK